MEYLRLHNFGPISDLDITLKKVNIFIGEQGVGKSTLAKLLSCCRDFVLYYVIVHKMEKRFITQIFSTYGIHTYFKKDTFIEYRGEKGLILTYKDGEFSLSFKDLDEAKTIELVDHILLLGVKRAYGGLGSALGSLRQEDIDKVLKDNSRIVFSNLRTSFYCPAERGIAGMLSNSLATLILSNTPLPQPLIEYMSFFEKARQEYVSFDIPFMHLAYSYEDGKDMVKVDGESVQLKYASSGIQSILPLLMVIEYCLQKNYFSSFTIEEPELNLFPTNQFHLLQTLISKTNEEKSKLGSWTLTTHSPYLLSVFNISLLAGRIAERFPEYTDELKEAIPPRYIIHTDEIAVYELRQDHSSHSCCVSILDEVTGLIKGNYLDSVSDIISADFNRLYKLYVRLTREKNRRNDRSDS